MAVIVVVDDERPLREFLADALEEHGYRVLQAINGRHALKVISSAGQDSPDLIISDVMMPVVGGVELCRAIKANPQTAAILVVLMSAVTQSAASLAGHADAFIAKPFDRDAIDVLVRSILSRP